MAQTGTVTASQLNFRSSPDIAANNIIGKLPRGTQVEILEERGDFLRVSFNGQEGFVGEGFVSHDEEQPAPVADDGSTGVKADLDGSANADATSSDSSGGSVQPAASQPAASSSSLKPGPAPAPGACKLVGNKAITPDGKVFAFTNKIGVFNNGATSIGAFVAAHRDLFPNVSPSRLRVMQAVSVNEGKLEAINTYDNSFMTFGCFQWTAGAGTDPGELPALLDRLKKRDAAVFQKYFGQFGLDVVMPQTPPNTRPTGFFSLNGTTLRTPAQKSQLRTLDWAYRFWLSGQDDTMRAVEIEHAMSRVDLFFRCPACLINTRFVGDYISSEYGIALLLDQHVNRPSHVPGTLARAVAQFAGGDPQGWQDTQEQKLINLYLQQRALTSMTNSQQRAQAILAAVNKGLASNKRGSYQA
jgi:hypothetical protein